MNQLIKIAFLTITVLLIGCGGSDEPKKSSSSPKPKSMIEEKLPPASERITLEDKGVGQIKDLTLDPEINQEWVAEGESIFNSNCTPCHKVDKRFIGPKMQGVLDRRSPEWVMNMILDPQLMVEEDRCAKDLLVEFNGAAMANQNLTVEQTRSILEFFRTL